MTTTLSGGAGLQALMAIADRYARRLVAGVGAPPSVLLVERAGELDVVELDGDGPDAIPRIRLLLGHSGATSAALLVEVPSASVGPASFWIFGESLDGTMVRRRYRVRPCGRARRLTPLADGEDPEVEGAFRPLFPMRVTRADPDDGVTDERDGTTSPTPSDPTAPVEQIVAA